MSNLIVIEKTYINMVNFNRSWSVWTSEISMNRFSGVQVCCRICLFIALYTQRVYIVIMYLMNLKVDIYSVFS